MGTNSATMLARLGVDLTQPVRRDMHTDTLNRRNEHATKLKDRLEAFAAKEKGIVANRALSDQGQQEQLAKLGEDALPRLAWLGRVVKDLSEAQARVSAQLFAVRPTVQDEMLRYVRAREIRDRMVGSNQAERDVAFVKVSQALDHETMWALLDAPGGNWVSADVQHRAEVERAKQTKPDLFSTFEQNALLLDYLGGLRDHVALWLRGLAVDPTKIADMLAMSTA